MELLKSYLSDFSDAEYKKGFDMMDDVRKSAVMRLRSDKDKRRSVLGEILARKGISKICGIPEAEIRFERTENGKPYAVNADIRFSISHSKDIVICALSEGEIGADAELVRDIDLRIAKFACTDADFEYLYEIEDENERNLRFFKIWTAKEAYVKYCGTGISYLKDINFKDIEKNCQFSLDGEYMIAIYRVI